MEELNKTLRIGIVGYSDKKFNKLEAKLLLIESILEILTDINCNACNVNVDVQIVSGLTNIGIPAIAYELAKKHKWKTVGVACKKAKDYEVFPVDEEIIVGDEWGDESKTFLENIDVLIRVGGGKQSFKEVQMANNRNIFTIEKDLSIIE